MKPSPVILPNDLILESLSFLPVKSLLRFRCVSNSWNTLIFDPAFVKLHLNRSSTRNPPFKLITEYLTDNNCDNESEMECSVVTYPTRCLLANPSFAFFDDAYYHLDVNGLTHIVGSCNGLFLVAVMYEENCLRIWNPATRTTSELFGYYGDLFDSSDVRFAFGCDNSTNTYKAVASRFLPDQLTTDVRVLSLANNVWKSIESFPVVPLDFDRDYCYDNLYLSDTLNWLAIRNTIQYVNIENIKVEDFVIVSLDLKTDTFNQYLLPRGFNEVPPKQPTIGVLEGCLYFSYFYEETDFVIWKMKKFGVEDSWTQFLKIRYQNLRVEDSWIHYFKFLKVTFTNDERDYDLVNYMDSNFQLVPLLLSEDDVTLVLLSGYESRYDWQVIIYNWRDNTGEPMKFTNSINNRSGYTPIYFYFHWQCCKDYVESLVSI